MQIWISFMYHGNWGKVFDGLQALKSKWMTYKAGSAKVIYLRRWGAHVVAQPQSRHFIPARKEVTDKSLAASQNPLEQSGCSGVA